jgi:hypothetical protein
MLKAVVGEVPLVIALADLGFVVRQTGKRVVDAEEPHVWHFDTRGQMRRSGTAPTRAT